MLSYHHKQVLPQMHSILYIARKLTFNLCALDHELQHNAYVANCNKMERALLAQIFLKSSSGISIPCTNFIAERLAIANSSKFTV